MHYRCQHLLLILLFLLLRVPASANDTLSFESVDRHSYQLYLRSSWDSLEHFCDRAFAGGFDYYYLRIRAGIACFSEKRYRKASGHFEKALAFNPGDELADQYLYYSYLYSGEYDHARALMQQFDTSFCKKAGIGIQPDLAMFMLEGGPRISSSSLFQTGVYAQAALAHYVNNRFSLFHALTCYRQDESRYGIRQFQYYLRLVRPLRHRWSFMAGGQFLYGHNIYSDTVLVAGPPGPGGGPGSPPMPSPPRREAESYRSNEFSYVASLGIRKSARFLDYGGGISCMANDSMLYYQLNGMLYYYPFANNFLSIGGNIYLHGRDELKNVYLSFAPALNITVKRWQLTATYLHNTHSNAIEYTGYLVNNSEDLSPDRYSLMIACPVAKQLSLYGVYSYETKRMNQTALAYDYNAFYIGIRFTPIN